MSENRSRKEFSNQILSRSSEIPHCSNNITVGVNNQKFKGECGENEKERLRAVIINFQLDNLLDGLNEIVLTKITLMSIQELPNIEFRKLQETPKVTDTNSGQGQPNSTSSCILKINLINLRDLLEI